MSFGLGTLRLSPDAFWRMTPRELAAAMEAVLGSQESMLDRASFAALRAQFPDASVSCTRMRRGETVRPQTRK